MRNQDEIQRAHDLLVGIILGEVPDVPVRREVKHDLITAASCLCWVLQHEHNLQFAEWILGIEDTLADLGYSLKKEAPPEYDS